MRFAAGALLVGLAAQASERIAPEPKHFRFERAIAVSAKAGERTCAVLDESFYAHAKPGLADVRLYAGSAEIPYARTMSETAASDEKAQVLNLGKSRGQVVFDLAMPSRPYSTVDLALGGANFLATAKVTGLASLTERAGHGHTELGTFTLFDLTAQRLGRSTSLAFAESTFPFLHVELAASAAPGHTGFQASAAMVNGASVPPSREAQTLYTTVARTTTVAQMEQKSVATFEVPAHVPVERVSFELDPQNTTNFSRDVHVSAQAVEDKSATNREAAFNEDLDGTISRVRISEGGKEIRRESLSVAATLGSNGQKTAKVKVSVDNGDDKPLAIRAVRLEMRERKLCFDSPAEPVILYYGDEKLAAPSYDYARLFEPEDDSVPARLESEQANPLYVARREQTTLIERHPGILWVALLAVVAVLGAVALRTAKRM